MATISDIAAGQELGEVRFQLDPSRVQGYIAAIEDRSELYHKSNLVPPTAVAALGVRAILEELALPPGTLHAAQELTMHRAIAVGEEVSCMARVAQSSKRQGWQFVVVEYTFADDGGRAVLDGRTTLMIPPQDK